MNDLVWFSFWKGAINTERAPPPNFLVRLQIFSTWICEMLWYRKMTSACACSVVDRQVHSWKPLKQKVLHQVLCVCYYTTEQSGSCTVKQIFLLIIHDVFEDVIVWIFLIFAHSHWKKKICKRHFSFGYEQKITYVTTCPNTWWQWAHIHNTVTLSPHISV